LFFGGMGCFSENSFLNIKNKFYVVIVEVVVFGVGVEGVIFV